MSVFTYEKRSCPNCDRTFDALEFWEQDAVCGDCSRRNYEERLRKIREGRSFTVTSIGGACPTQAEGVTAGGRPYYFRARHGNWTLEVGEPGWPDFCDWPPESWGEQYVADGDDPSNGWMEDDDVLAILDEHLPSR